LSLILFLHFKLLSSPLKALWYHHAVVYPVEGTAIILTISSALFCKISIFYGKNENRLKIFEVTKTEKKISERSARAFGFLALK